MRGRNRPVPGQIVSTEIVLQAGTAEPGRRWVHGVATLGGSQADTIAVPALPPAALRLEPCAAGLVVRPAVAGLRLAGHPVAPGSARLLRPGERAILRGLALELPPEATDGPTRVGAAALLRQAVDGRAFHPGPHLVVLTGDDAGERVALPPELVIGRGRAAGLRIRDPGASRRHARVVRGAAEVTIEDLGAKNRLRVNGVAVERRPVALRPGDRITVGETELAYEDGGHRAVDPMSRTPRPRSPCPPHRRARRGARPLAATGLLAATAAALAAASSCGL